MVYIVCHSSSSDLDTSLGSKMDLVKCLGKVGKELGVQLQSNFSDSNIFGTMEICLRYGSLSDWGLIMAPGQEANNDDLEKSFWFFTQ